MDWNLVIGNVSTLFAMGANAISSTRKTAKGALLSQCVSQLIYFFCAVVLSGYSAAVQNVVSILRNIAAVRNIKSKIVEWGLITAGVVFGVVFNNRGLVGLLPVVGNLQYTLVIFWSKGNERSLKISFLISVISFAVFNAVLYNFVGTASDLVVIITTSIVLLKGITNKSVEKPDAGERNEDKKT